MVTGRFMVAGAALLVTGALVVTSGCAGGNAVVPATPRLASPCTIHRLAMLDGAKQGSVGGAPPDGETLAGEVASGPTGRPIGILWRDGRVLATVPGAPVGFIDLNSRGEGVGNSSEGPWIYRDGAIRRLAPGSRINAIGEDGTLVGSRLAPTSNGPPVAVPVKWPSGSEQPVDLPMPSRETGKATDIAVDGTIVGYVAVDPFVWHADDSSGRLPRPTGAPPYERISALRIGGPWLVGNAPGVGILRWHLGPETVEAIPGVRFEGTGYGPANAAVNTSGTVLVKSGYDALVTGGGRAVILPSLGPGYLNHPVSISADARTLAGTTVLNRNPGSGSLDQPVSWTCGN